MAALGTKTSLVEWKNLRFLIMDAPKDTNLHLYLKECKKNNVTQIVRISEPSYSKDEVEKAGIGLNVSVSFQCLAGCKSLSSYPLVSRVGMAHQSLSFFFLMLTSLLQEMFYEDGQSPPPEVISRWLELVSRTFDATGAKDAKPCIAVHCVAGLGRAPVLVAIALVEYGLDAGSAVSFIRDRRRGAINAVQLSYLQSYKKTRRGGGKCSIS